MTVTTDRGTFPGATAVVMQDSLDQAREDALAIEDMARKTLAGSTFNWSATGLSARKGLHETLVLEGRIGGAYTALFEDDRKRPSCRQSASQPVSL